MVLALSLVAILTIPSATAATDVPAFPDSEEEWLAMSPAEQAALMDHQRKKLDILLGSGTAEVYTVYGTSAPADSASTMSISVSRNCYVQWIIIPGEGDWVRGGGWTSASDEVDHIWAGRSGKKGKFYRDGQLKGNWYQERWPGSYAERQSDYHWAFWWEYVHWTTQGWHGAYNNGQYLMNDSYCFAEKWM
ncbi:MAG: hypothetical protein ACRDGD_11395 [Candidatus Limnocylindria bacterium]